jgi:hypothetical protein
MGGNPHLASPKKKKAVVERAELNDYHINGG